MQRRWLAMQAQAARNAATLVEMAADMAKNHVLMGGWQAAQNRARMSESQFTVDVNRSRYDIRNWKHQHR
jgi:hypothetical protein